MTPPRPLRLRALALVLAIQVLVGTTPAAALGPLTVPDERGLRTAIGAIGQLATDTRKGGRKGQKVTPPRRGLPIKLGKDGRLTVLILGSDWRRTLGGERFDVVMVGSIDPLTGEAALVSIPRDMGGIPFAGGGNSGGMRVNSIYFIRYRDRALPHGRIDRKAVKRFSRDIGVFLGTEIDYWALTRFATFAGLINKLGGVRLAIDEAVHDPSYHHRRFRGVWFPRAEAYRLRGDPQCRPRPRRCHSALVYARSRKGTMGDEFNNDFRRAERQQDIVRAGIRQVLDDGGGLSLLGTALRVRDLIETDMPKTVEAAAQLYSIASRFRLPASNRKVFAPATWGSLASDGTVRPNLRQIRRWVDRMFYRVRPTEGERD